MFGVKRGAITEATTRPRNCYCRPGETHCGRCLVCGRAGHSCHYPGPLPFAGGWCDEHYAVLFDRMGAATDLDQPYGLRDAERAYFVAPGQRRWLLWRSVGFAMEFRSQFLT